LVKNKTLLSLDQFSSEEKYPLVSSGSILIDRALGGGFPGGCITDIHGFPSAGKSLVAFMAAKRLIQTTGKNFLYIDIEKNFIRESDRKRFDHWGIPRDRISYMPTDFSEVIIDQLINILEEDKEKHSIGLVILDSMGALTSKNTADAEVGKVNTFIDAKTNAQMLKKINVIDYKCPIIVLNHLNTTVGKQGSINVPGGGSKVQYEAKLSLRVSAQTAELSDDKTKRSTTHMMDIKFHKSKVNWAQGSVIKDVKYCDQLAGYDNEYEVTILGQEQGLVTTAGSWYQYGEKFRYQGIKKFTNALREYPDVFNELYSQLT
jgi:recombination protein RecA